MFYAAYRLDGKEYGKLYTNHREYFSDTFCPETEHLAYIPFRVTGKTYQEKRECVRKQAIDFSSAVSYGNLSYGELYEIQSWFAKQASRFGLLKEFRENAIC